MLTAWRSLFDLSTMIFSVPGFVEIRLLLLKWIFYLASVAVARKKSR